MDWKALFGNRIFKILFAGVVTAGTLAAQPYRPVVVVGNSMQPTYQDHEFTIASTALGALRRGDVVVVQGPQGPMVKRIAYLPGDSITYLYFGREWMLASDGGFRKLKDPDKFPKKTVVVPEGYVFVLGDNPDVSIDSRQLGVLPISQITAKIPNPRPQSSA